MSGRRMICGALVTALFCTLPFSGCGKKGDPIPPRLTLPPAIAGVTADSVAEGILIGWSASGPVAGMDHFRIVRAEVPAERACPGCPQDYSPLAAPRLDDPAVRRTAGGRFGYLDVRVKGEHFYSYRISVCDSRGNCGKPSDPAGLVRDRR